MIFTIYDCFGMLCYEGDNWEFARLYLDYLVRTYDAPPELIIKWRPSPSF